MKFKRLIILCCVSLFGFVLSTNKSFSQESYNMLGFELQLEPLMNEMFEAKNANERFAANDKFLTTMEDALLFENSFSYHFEKLSKISILTSKDKQFRILTWAIVNQEGEWENYGYVQARNAEDGTYEVYRLYDKSDEITDPETQKLDDSTWFGAVYYDLIQTKADNATIYTLLGWDGNNIYSRRKIIEPISFKRNSGKPIFGKNIFYKEKDRMRFIFEYSTQTNFTLKYGEQYYEVEGQTKTKSTLFHKARPFEVEPPKTAKEKLIFFDLLEPENPSMAGLTQYYVPSGEVVGLKFENNKWKKIKYNVLPRNAKEQNDDYQPDNTIKHTLFPINKDKK